MRMSSAADSLCSPTAYEKRDWRPSCPLARGTPTSANHIRTGGERRGRSTRAFEDQPGHPWGGSEESKLDRSERKQMLFEAGRVNVGDKLRQIVSERVLSLPR